MKDSLSKFGLTLVAISVCIAPIAPGWNQAKAGEQTTDFTVETHKAGSSPGQYSNKQILHLLNRISFGAEPGELEAVKKIGVDAFIQQQLHPQSISIPDELKQIADVDALKQTPANLFLTYGRPALKELTQKGGSDKEQDKKDLQKVLKETYQKLYLQSAEAHVTRAAYSPAQLQEVMTDFWFNHFNISADKNLDHLWIGSYEEKAIRPFVLGKFRDLLGATAHHAGMLFYLDNWQNTAPQSQAAGGRFKGINENYARELMELHTLGVDGGYTQKDVQELARVLTGLGLPPGTGGGGAGAKRKFAQGGFAQGQLAAHGGGFGAQGAGGRFGAQRGSSGQGLATQRRFAAGQGFGGDRQSQGFMEYGGQAPLNVNNNLGSYFDARRHDFGTKLVVGNTINGTGEDEIEKVLDILSKHPSTAHHISYQLAQYFVSDNPPATLVDKLSKRFLDTDGDIAQVMDTLLHSQEFWDAKAVNAKFKSPYRYLISTMRATNADVENIQPSLGLLSQLGEPLYKCLTPDGYKNTQAAWLNPDNLLNRLNFATAYGADRFPGIKPTVKDPTVVADCIGPTLSDKTIDAVMKSPENMRISLLLGSPEFMKY